VGSWTAAADESFGAIGMTTTEPLWLIGLGLTALIWWVHKRGIGAVPLSQRRAALTVRCFIVVALVLALAGVSMSLPERRLATVFVVDRSDSVSGVGAVKAEEFVRAAIDQKPSDALVGVVVAGEQARVEVSVQQDPKLTPFASDPGGSRTDLARAMRLAAAILPEGTRRRIVVLSDGRENSGDARYETSRLRRSGFRIDTVSLSGPSGPDAGVLSVSAPSKVRQGDEFDVEIEIFSNLDGSATLTLTRGDSVVDRRQLVLEAGRQKVVVKQSATAPGSLVYRADLHSDRDAVGQNDRSSALVIVQGPPRVIVLEGEDGEGEAVARALSDRGFVVDRRGLSGFPSGVELAATDSMILVDVAATNLTTTQMETLGSFVRGLGRGLVAIGGESSWSLGNYRETLLEDLLPVSSEIKDPKRRPSIAQALVVDVSGSMEGEKSKIAKAAAARAVEALSGDDELGILAFSDRSEWVLPIQKVPSDEVVRKGIGKLVTQGGTNIPGAIVDATKGLKESKAALKHIILFSDGFNGAGDLFAAAKAAADEGITLSVVGTGESAAEDLARLADVGKGRFYPGRDLQQIPELIMNEVILAARKYINEGSFTPKITGSSAATDGLEAAPVLLGYIGTSAKPSTSVSLSIGEFDDPLLATWRTGLGVASAWTSDVKGRWGRHWIAWDGFADFWANVVKETVPADPVPGFSLRAIAGQDGIEIVVESETPISEGVGGKATILDPEGRALEVPLHRTGISAFGGTLPGGIPGAYLMTAEISDDKRVIYRDSVGAIRTFSSEYRPGPADERLLTEVAKAASGKFGIRPGDAFRTDLPLGRRQIDLAPWLLVIALVLFPVDIALRRVVLTREEIRRLVPARRAAPVVVTDSIERLFKATRAVRRPSESGSVSSAGARPLQEASDVGIVSTEGRPDEPRDEQRPEPTDTAAALLAMKRRRK